MSFSNKEINYDGDNATHGREGDKPIPFLRRLIDMLQENEEIISFFPGSRNENGQCTPGRIVVHDRVRVEAEILPRYFNHSSFASLRRQLNYFAFCRVGKGKQKGATYCNENVIDILDILLLKRRAVGSTIPVVQEKKFQVSSQPIPSPIAIGDKKVYSGSSSQGNAVSIDSRSNVAVTEPDDCNKQKRKRSTKKSKKTIVNSLVPVVHLPPKKPKFLFTPTLTGGIDSNKVENEVVNTSQFSVSISPPPADSSFGNKVSPGPQISLDLTKPPSFTQYNFGNATGSMCTHNTKEADVLAGCSALLALGYQPSA